jgi:ferrous iron transport protein B
MRIGLIGNPNVGKSLIFHQLTGIGVAVSNYPGTTVDLKRGSLCLERERMEIVDLPGVYSLDGQSSEEQMVRTFLQEGGSDALVAVLDAAHLERNLYLIAQVAEYGVPLVLVLNMMDEAEASGIEIDIAGLSQILGVEIVPVTAIQGKNIGKIIPAAISARPGTRIEVHYDHHVEAAVRSLQSMHHSTRLEALQALQGIGNRNELLESAEVLGREIERIHLMSVSQIIAGNRHHFAHRVTAAIIHEKLSPRQRDLDRLLTSRVWGVLILAGTLIAILALVFLVGSAMEGLLVRAFDAALVTPFRELALPPIATQLGLSFLLALQAGLGIALPFIFTFYLAVSILEDSGYLTRAAFLADRAMHRVGMHGQGIIPMVLGFGCTVPAIMSIRLLGSRRERTIAAFLVTLVPCSARTVVIAGMLAAFVGIGAALSVYLVVFILVIVTGLFLSRVTPGEQLGMIMELTPLRRPQLSNVLAKSWYRVRDFLVVAMPLLVGSSIVLGLLQWAGFFTLFQEFIGPYSTTILGLPGYATTALIFGILRKEMALETLVILAGTADLATVMTPVQLYIFALVAVLFIPCVSTIGVLYREVGARIAVLVCLYTLSLGVIIGWLINIIMT